MQWVDDAIVIGTRGHGEAAVMAELMTRAHGRHLGLVHGGRSRRLGPVLQAGNSVRATWRARLDEQLGTYVVESETSRAARLIGSPLALSGLAAVAAHLRLLPERDPHPELYEAALAVADHLHDPALAPVLFLGFELTLLSELGFGLDLSACAATGRTDDLLYVSPRTGRAVCREAGEPYRARLLALPAFLAGAARDPGPDEIAAGFRLTAHFLDAHVHEPRGRAVCEERERFVARVLTSVRAGEDDGSGTIRIEAAGSRDSARDGTA